MRSGRFLVLVILVFVLAGCDARVLVDLDLPIVVTPEPVYRAEVDGYLSYNYRTHNVRLTNRPNQDRSYEPLQNARVLVVETGTVTYTDRSGYFHVRGVPYGRINLNVRHNRVGPSAGLYFTTRSY